MSACASPNNPILNTSPLLRVFTDADIPTASAPALLSVPLDVPRDGAWSCLGSFLKANGGRIIDESRDCGLITTQFGGTTVLTAHLRTEANRDPSSPILFVTAWDRGIRAKAEAEQMWLENIARYIRACARDVGRT